MKKTLLLALILSASCYAQAGSVVKQLFTGVTTVPQDVRVPNFGQVGHEVFVQLANVPGHNCGLALINGATINGSLQGSFDETNWISFGSPNSNAANGVTFPLDNTALLYLGTGVFNFVRFDLSAFDTTDCTATATYVGFPNSTALQSEQGAAPVGSSYVSNGALGSVINPSAIAGWGGFTLPSTLTPYTACNNTSIATSTAGSFIEVNLLGQPLDNIGVCGLTVSLSAAGTVQFYYSVGTDCSTNNGQLILPFTLAQGIPLTLGSATMGLLFQTGGGALITRRLCMASTGGNATVAAYFMRIG